MGRQWRLDGPVSDSWSHPDDEEDLVAGQSQTVTWSRWTGLPEDERNRLKWQGIGVRVPQDISIEEFGSSATAFEIIVVRIEAFEDGRHFSLVRQLRDRFAYQGTIRASGSLLPDQLEQARRCGYDEFELAGTHHAQDITDALARYTAYYQPDVTGRSRIRAARRGLAEEKVARDGNASAAG